MIKITPLANSIDRYELIEEHKFTIKDKELTIPKAFYFDGASIPKIFWSVMGHPFSPMLIEAALEHDYLFYIKHDVEEANHYFKFKLKEKGVSSLKASLMYGAVKLYSIATGRY